MDRDSCENGTPDQMIISCTKLISDLNESANNHAAAYFNRGLSYQRKGDLDRAIADYNETLKLNPQDADAYSNRGVAYKDKKEYDRAITDGTEAIRLNPQNAKSYHNRGTAFEMAGKREPAIADYRKALSLNPLLEKTREALKRIGAE